MKKFKKSKYGKLNVLDVIKGSLLASIAAVVTLLHQQLTAGNVDFKTLGEIALMTFLSYLIKNVFENEKGTFGK